MIQITELQKLANLEAEDKLKVLTFLVKELMGMRELAPKTSKHAETTPKKHTHQTKRQVSESMQEPRQESSLKNHGAHKSDHHAIKKADLGMSSKKWDETLGSD